MSQTRITFSLGLEPAPAGLPDAAAWFIPGDDPRLWLREMVAWNVPLECARLHVIPGAGPDRRPVGVMVAGLSEKPAPVAAIGYVRLGQRLYLPADGRLSPALTAAEADAALGLAAYVMHPSAGLVGFGAEDVLSVADLLAGPDCLPTNWDWAVPGVHTASRLEGIDVETPPQIETMLDTGRDDIGSEDFDELPPDPEQSPVGDAARAAIRRIMTPILKALTGKGNPNSGAGNENWARRRLRKMWAASEELRDREIRRLLELLAADPDSGLRFALPLHALPTRGTALPSNQLSERKTDFNLSHVMGGNQPSDSWTLSSEARNQLREQYLAAANRELNLGRFQRAAYIFAFLLGDYSSAADALKRGRHFREAAVIYRGRLNNPLAAASCLAEGGLLPEAVAIYTELRMFERAGDLHLLLEEAAEARECFERAARKLIDERQFLAAAKLWEIKLADPTTALNVLESAWPAHDASGVCLLEWFNLAGRVGSHGMAIDRIAGFERQTSTAKFGLPLVVVLSRTAGTYPNPAVRLRAADCARVLVGHRLTAGDCADRKALVKAVTNLSPADYLLRRDGDRFLDSNVQKPAPRPTPAPSRAKGPTLEQQFRLSVGCSQWGAVVAISGGFLAAGAFADGIIVVRGNWSGGMVEQIAQRSNATDCRLMLIPPGPKDLALLTVFDRGGAVPMHECKLKLSRTKLIEANVDVVTPEFIDRTVLGVCLDTNDTVWVLKGTHTADAELVAHGDGGKVLAGYRPDLGSQEPLVPPNPMAAREGRVFVAIGSKLIEIKSGKADVCATLPWPIKRIIVSPRHTVPRLLVSMENGVALLWEEDEYQWLGQNLPNPVASFTPEGIIVVASDQGGQLYRSAGAKTQCVANFELKPKTPIAVLPSSNGTFAVFYADGLVERYRMS